MRRAPPALASALAFALLAGCLVPTPDSPQVGVTTARAAWFTADLALADDAPADVKGVRAGSFFDKWRTGADYPTWRAAPATADVAIENVTVNVTIRATGPVLETARFPDLMVYAGSGDAWMTINTTQTPSVLVPGQQYRYTLAIPSPRGGMWVPAGEPFGLKVVPVMHQNDAADIEIVVGGDQGSWASWTERVVPPLAPLAPTNGKDQGELAGSEYAGQAAPASARHRTAILSNATPTLLVAWMNTTENQGVPDLDLELVSPGGESLVFAGTPTPREMLRLREFNLEESGTYTLVTHNYGSARATFVVEWAIG